MNCKSPKSSPASSSRGYQKLWGQSIGDNSSVANEWPHREYSNRSRLDGQNFNMPLLYESESGAYGLYSEAD